MQNKNKLYALLAAVIVVLLAVTAYYNQNGSLAAFFTGNIQQKRFEIEKEYKGTTELQRKVRSEIDKKIKNSVENVEDINVMDVVGMTTEVNTDLNMIEVNSNLTTVEPVQVNMIEAESNYTLLEKSELNLAPAETVELETINATEVVNEEMLTVSSDRRV